MNRRLLLPIVTAGMALASGVASANHQYWRDNGLLLEVSADPRDGTDVVQVDPTRADSLQLVALNDVVRLRGMTLHLIDGRAISQRLGFVYPGQPVVLDLPERCGAITSVELDYGNPAYRPYDRTPARLQIVPIADARSSWRDDAYPRYPRSSSPTTYQPAPYYRSAPSYTTPSYTVQPRYPQRRVHSGWTIQGSFRF